MSAGFSPPGQHSSARMLLDVALREAEESGAEVRRLDLTEIAFLRCPLASRCRWPCLLTKVEEDGLGVLYDLLVDWADVTLISSAVEDGGLPEPMRRAMDRLRCVRHALEVDQVQLLRNKVAGFLLCGQWDPTKGVAPELAGFFGSLGFTLPPFAVVGPSPDSCFAAESERLELLLQLVPEAADTARALAGRATDLASKLLPPPRGDLFQETLHLLG